MGALCQNGIRYGTIAKAVGAGKKTARNVMKNAPADSSAPDIVNGTDGKGCAGKWEGNPALVRGWGAGILYKRIESTGADQLNGYL